MSETKFYHSDNTLLAKRIREYLNSWKDKPSEFLFDDFGDSSPALMLQQLASAEIVKRYVNGSFIATYKFAVYARSKIKDTQGRFDSLSLLSDLVAWAEEKTEKGEFVNLPILDDNRTATKIEAITCPSTHARYEDGTVDYQVLFNLIYINRRN